MKGIEGSIRIDRLRFHQVEVARVTCKGNKTNKMQGATCKYTNTQAPRDNLSKKFTNSLGPLSGGAFRTGPQLSPHLESGRS